MSKVIIYDFETFMYDCLLGANIIDENGKSYIYQTWVLDEIREFYKNHQNDLWVGHNNYEYDDLLLDGIVKFKDPYETNSKIMAKTYISYNKIKLYSIDLMRLKSETYALKLTELLCGKNIHTTEVPFTIKRQLTKEEKEKTERYNRSDLIQTTYNYNMMYDLIKLKFDIITEFNLNLLQCLSLPGSALAAKVLNAKYNPSLQYAEVKPILYDNLKLTNSTVLDYYMKKRYKSDEPFTILFNGVELSFGNGGMHGAVKQAFFEKVIYIDVKGYYNLLALLYDLLPRNLSDEAKLKYKHMYETQLELKKTNPVKREAYKVILLAVIGSMFRANSPFYDPENYLLLTALGQVFIYSLLERLQDLIDVVQVNTDGLMIVPKDWNNVEAVISIAREWEKETGFDIKIDYLYNLWQRDVNTYCCQDDKGNVICKGDAFKNYDIGDKAYASQSIFKCKEAPIIAQGIVQFLIYGITPEDYISKHKRDLRLYQYACSTGKGYDYLTYDSKNIRTMEEYTEKIQSPSRVFALKSNEIYGTVYKHKDRFGKVSQSKYPSLPDNSFIYNYALSDADEEIYKKIDYQYYVEKIYKKLRDFIGE